MAGISLTMTAILFHPIKDGGFYFTSTDLS